MGSSAINIFMTMPCTFSVDIHLVLKTNTASFGKWASTTFEWMMCTVQLICWHLQSIEIGHAVAVLIGGTKCAMCRVFAQQVTFQFYSVCDCLHIQLYIVDEGIHNDLTEIVNEHSSKVNATFPDDCFQKLFWMQQQKASALTNTP